MGLEELVAAGERKSGGKHCCFWRLINGHKELYGDRCFFIVVMLRKVPIKIISIFMVYTIFFMYQKNK